MHAQKSKRVGRVGTRIDANDAGAVSGAVISGVVFGADPADASRGCEFEPFDEFRAVSRERSSPRRDSRIFGPRRTSAVPVRTTRLDPTETIPSRDRAPSAGNSMTRDAVAYRRVRASRRERGGDGEIGSGREFAPNPKRRQRRHTRVSAYSPRRHVDERRVVATPNGRDTPRGGGIAVQGEPNRFQRRRGTARGCSERFGFDSSRSVSVPIRFAPIRRENLHQQIRGFRAVARRDPIVAEARRGKVSPDPRAEASRRRHAR